MQTYLCRLSDMMVVMGFRTLLSLTLECVFLFNSSPKPRREFHAWIAGMYYVSTYNIISITINLTTIVAAAVDAVAFGISRRPNRVYIYRE
jgi:hypothetical protein